MLPRTYDPSFPGHTPVSQDIHPGHMFPRTYDDIPTTYPQDILGHQACSLVCPGGMSWRLPMSWGYVLGNRTQDIPPGHPCSPGHIPRTYRCSGRISRTYRPGHIPRTYPQDGCPRHISRTGFVFVFSGDCSPGHTSTIGGVSWVYVLGKTGYVLGGGMSWGTGYMSWAHQTLPMYVEWIRGMTLLIMYTRSTVYCTTQ